MIPFAESPDASCLDIGCYGYMGFWAWCHLGYSHVEGIEMRPDISEPVFTRDIELGQKKLALKVHNFNITLPEWPIREKFDTVLFFETLEHVDQDPSGVLLNVTRCMRRDSFLVLSVPNAISYKVLREFITGAPPWVYWFFHPDLSHEPRHSFEYTPIFFKMALRSAGLTEVAFRTICAFAEPETVADIFEIGRALSIKASLFGDTMIALTRKTSEEPLFRYPDCLYSGDRYYHTTYPALHERLTQARERYFEQHDAALRDARAQAAGAVAARELAEAELAAAAAQCREALFLCSSYLGQVQAARAATARVMADYDAVIHSTFWRVTGPARRFGTRHPRFTARVRAVLVPVARACRRALHSMRGI